MAQKPAIIDQHKNIILFDGVCNLCSSFLNFVYKYDTKAVFKFAWIQSEEASEILKWLNMPTHIYNTIIYIESGHSYYKSTAFLKIVKHLQGPWPILKTGYCLPTFIRDWLYDVVAKNRYKIFGKKESCLLPTGDLNSRFLHFK